MERNKNIAKLREGYLFPEINRRKRKFLENNPNAKIISLGIGNTTEPLKKHITKALVEASTDLGTVEGYSGYGDEQGLTALRDRIAEKLYGGIVSGEEVFTSDGAKCDIGRLQVMFGNDVSVAVQDPSYPVYVDGSVIIGATGEFDDSKKQFGKMTYLPCTPENGFFPDLERCKKTDVIYFCSPNNPTGAVSTKKQLKELIDCARDNKSIIVYDAAYAEYITDKKLPKTIFEIEGARDVALEVNSFSKPLGFTGVRLGWTVVPNELTYDGGEKVIDDWNRVTCTIFNGASNIVQKAALSALDDAGLDEMRKTVGFYMENAAIIRKTLKDVGVEVYGGDNAPYIWARFPGRKSWDVFEEILETANVVTTPGSGFGPAGEGFLRFSSFGHRKDIIEACERLEKNLG
ncbi:MAG: LL-diaminopimelate aminotransferase [Candidatus Altiarchaeota archaeon]|nr:LL-diaminopimelate aminotransferase [Candidatus Altiarchaeota archaeon]